MNSTNTPASMQAEPAANITAIPSRSELSERTQQSGRARHPADDAPMSEAVRAIVWITGVAFGVLAPGIFAQNAVDTGATQKIRVLQTPITDNRGRNRADVAAIERECE
jgi:hypothetical protein